MTNRLRWAANPSQTISSLPGITRSSFPGTDRLGNVIRVVGYNTGGLPGRRLLERVAIVVSDDTVLRTIKSPGVPEVTEEAVHHLGVDDWAWRKGQNYGTILVDLERHQVIDVLPDRSAKSLQEWLSHRTTIRTVNRDRAGAYAEGTSKGAPDAIQIADRFHLFVNFSEAVERVLESKRQELQVPLHTEIPAAEKDLGHTKPETAAQRTKTARRCRRLERYQQMLELHKSGHSQKSDWRGTWHLSKNRSTLDALERVSGTQTGIGKI
ncbi:MAG: transposase [Acidobacteriota bacterium]|nr:transposase [Acidobacteriota bacterium]